MREPTGAAPGDVPDFETIDRLRGRLSDYLSMVAKRPVSVERVTKYPAGFSWITYAVTLSGFS